MSDTASRGRFIVLEGLDGAGTSTQTALLAGWLRERGIPVVETKEPTSGPVGSLIREVLAERQDMDARTLALAFAADRADHNESFAGIRESLDAGSWVISDRYVLSSLAYQGSDGLPLDWLGEINRFALSPDLTIFLAASPETCAQRIAGRSNARERFEGLERSRATLAAYEESLRRGDFVRNLIRIDGEPPQDEVQADLRRQTEMWLSHDANP